LLFGIFPRGEKADPIREQVKAVNAGISQLADDNRVRFLDIGNEFLLPDGTLPRSMFHDLLHPDVDGYQIWANALLPELDDLTK
jgi:lysophospholipase L1-like esterase